MLKACRTSFGNCVWLMLVLLFSGGQDAQSEAIKRPITFEDLIGIKTTNYLQISPDGTGIVYTESGDIWFAATAPSSSPRKLAKGSNPIWSPNSKLLAYYADATESNGPQLWLFDVAGGNAKQLTTMVGGIRWLSGMSGHNHSWSPDSSKLVFAAIVTEQWQDTRAENSAADEDNAGEPIILTRETPSGWAWAGLIDVYRPDFYRQPVKTSHLFVVDVETLSIKKITRDSAQYFRPDWSPDGNEIVFSSYEGRPIDGVGPDTSNIYVINQSTGSKRAMTSGPGRKMQPAWSPDGKHLAWATDWKGISVTPVSGGGTSFEFDIPVWRFSWLPDGSSIAISYASDSVRSAVWPISLLHFPTGRVEPIGAKESLAISPSVSRSGAIAWVESTASTPQIIRVLPAGQTKSYVVYDLNPQAKEWLLGEQEVIRWKNNYGFERAGILIKPVGYKEGRRYPVIVSVYPYAAHANGFQRATLGYGNQAYASRGYAVFFPRPRAAWHWKNYAGREREALRGPKGLDIMVDDVVSGADELIRQGIADPDRMGLLGHSNGGGVVDNVVVRSGRFKCAVALASSEPQLQHALMEDTRNPIMAESIGVGSVWEPENVSSYIEYSPIFRVKQVTTPLLLAVGDLDGFREVGMIELFLGLRHFGKEVTLVRYPNQGHEFDGAAARDFWQRENTFFDKYLKSETQVVGEE